MQSRVECLSKTKISMCNSRIHHMTENLCNERKKQSILCPLRESTVCESQLFRRHDGQLLCPLITLFLQNPIRVECSLLPQITGGLVFSLDIIISGCLPVPWVLPVPRSAGRRFTCSGNSQRSRDVFLRLTRHFTLGWERAVQPSQAPATVASSGRRAAALCALWPPLCDGTAVPPGTL